MTKRQANKAKEARHTNQEQWQLPLMVRPKSFHRIVSETALKDSCRGKPYMPGVPEDTGSTTPEKRTMPRNISQDGFALV